MELNPAEYLEFMNKIPGEWHFVGGSKPEVFFFRDSMDESEKRDFIEYLNSPQHEEDKRTWKKSCSHDAWTYPDMLYLAIGKVAAESALLDEMLNELLDELIGNEHTWLLTTGQNTDWLIQSCRLVFEALNPDPNENAEKDKKILFDLFSRVGELRSFRNQVVHGDWDHSGPSLFGIRPRPWRDFEQESVLYVTRARIRKGHEEKVLKLAEVQQLAVDLAKLRDDLVRHFRQMRNLDASSMPRWACEQDHESERFIE
jgi:HAMP domain-containing protein